MHLDTDVWPSQLIAAPLLAQYPESHSPGCEPQIIEGALTQGGLELPAEWQVVALGAHPTGRRNQLRNPRRNQHSFHQALRAGRRGPGSQPPPLRRVTSIPDKLPLPRRRTVLSPRLPGLSSLQSRYDVRRRSHRISIPSPNVAFGPNHAARRGFTHLIADAKADANIARRLELRTQRDDLGSRPRTHQPPNRPACAHTSAG